MALKAGHPLSETHILTENPGNIIVTLLSKRLPKSTSQNQQDLHYFYLSCLLLFKPFSDIQILNDWIQNLAFVYTEFKQSAPQWISDYIENNDDYWTQAESDTRQPNQPEHETSRLNENETEIEDFDEYNYMDNENDIPDSILHTNELPVQYHCRQATEISSTLTNIPNFSKSFGFVTFKLILT
jgi:hypothetical protein